MLGEVVPDVGTGTASNIERRLHFREGKRPNGKLDHLGSASPPSEVRPGLGERRERPESSNTATDAVPVTKGGTCEGTRPYTRPIALAVADGVSLRPMRRPRSLRTTALAAAVGLSALLSVTAATADVAIPFTRTVLPNGLTVILHENHDVPIVAVNVSYGVGSRFEVEKRTGFAHLFEHLMFMGTRRVPTKAFDAWMEGAGGWNNAWTTEDRTDYYDVGPPSSLDLLLWMEADRLSDLGPLMTLDKLNAQREVVRNERRQSSENTPYGKVELRLPELMYPADHPYHHPVIGSHADLEAATVDDVKGFFAKYYDPANASLVVAGDFDPIRTKARIEQLFGVIPSHGPVADPGAPGFSDTKTTLPSVVRETIEAFAGS